MARATVDGLGLKDISVTIAPIALGKQRPPWPDTRTSANGDVGPDTRHWSRRSHRESSDWLRSTGSGGVSPRAAAIRQRFADRSFVHSHGLEEWLRRRGDVSVDAIRDLVEATVCHAVAPLDGTVLVHAHAAETLVELRRLDEVITARKLNPAARHASQACRRRVAAFAAPGAPGPVDQSVSRRDPRRKTDGNLAMSRASGSARGLSALEAVLVELRGATATLLSAAVRLGALSPIDAQTTIAQIGPSLVVAARAALTRTLDQLSANTPELEIAVMSHRRTDARSFAS